VNTKTSLFADKTKTHMMSSWLAQLVKAPNVELQPCCSVCDVLLCMTVQEVRGSTPECQNLGFHPFVFEVGK